jgi:membrane-bound ClpP family serine protease
MKWRSRLNPEAALTTELDVAGMAIGVFLFTFGVVLIAVGLSTPSMGGCTVYGAVLAPLGAAALAYSAADKKQAQSA